MPDIHSTAKRPDRSPPNPLFTKYDEFGRPVLIIEPAGKPPTISVCRCGCGKGSSEKERIPERLDEPGG
jgi:hypothetical protein